MKTKTITFIGSNWYEQEEKFMKEHPEYHLGPPVKLLPNKAVITFKIVTPKPKKVNKEDEKRKWE